MVRKVAAITGGGRGIGLGISQALAKDGFSLAVCGRKEEKEVESLPALRELRADVAEAADREAFLQAIRGRFGRLDVLVNNAGIAPRTRADILDAGEDSFDELIHVNLKGPYFLTQQAARWMIAQRREDPTRFPAIINVTSVSASMASTPTCRNCRTT